MRVFTVMAAMLSTMLAACSEAPPARTVAGGNAVVGKRLIEQYQCGSCHAIPDIPAAASKAGPPLEDFARRSYIAGGIPNLPDGLVAFIKNPPAHQPGTMMPNLGVSDAEARHMAAYLYTLR